MRASEKVPNGLQPQSTRTFWKYIIACNQIICSLMRGALSLKSDALNYTRTLSDQINTQCASPVGQSRVSVCWWLKVLLERWMYMRTLSCTSPPTKWLLILAISIKIIKFIYSSRWSISALCFSTAWWRVCMCRKVDCPLKLLLLQHLLCTHMISFACISKLLTFFVFGAL